jgi:segregation and condensation protein B
MTEEKNKIEAVLFTTGKFLTIEEVSQMCGIGSIGFVRQSLGELQEEYKTRGGALEIVSEKNRWKLNIHKDFLYLTEKLLSDAELDLPAQETLAVIAYKQPAIQSDVIQTRGNKAYDHIKRLKEEGFLVSERFGRTKILKLTQKFYDYFDVVEEELKEKLGGESIKIEKLPVEEKETISEEKNIPEQEDKDLPQDL